MRLVAALVSIGALVAGCGAVEGIEEGLSTITIPDVTLPDVTLPDVTLPDLTIPDITLPDVTLPELTTTTTVATATTVPPQPTTSAVELTTTTTAPAATTTEPPAQTTTTTAPAATTTEPPAQTTTTTAPAATTTEPPAEATTTSPDSDTTLVEAAPSTTIVGDDPEEEAGSGWWLLALLIAAAAVGTYALWRARTARQESEALAAQQEAWSGRMRAAYVQGRWVLDQLDERLAVERRSDPDARGLRAGIETVLGDMYALEADATDPETRAVIRGVSESIRDLDRAVDARAAQTEGGGPTLEDARSALVEALDRIAAQNPPARPDPTV
jgi:hypothetical protein